jgi:HAD superfamily hydrolase (TIGR01549 family)
MAVRAVIFDLDGTLTQPFFDFDAIREEMGYPRDAGPVLELMEKMTAAERNRAERILLAHEQRAVELSTLNAGAGETLAAIRSAGLPVGILTRNLRRNAFAVARKHGLVFDYVVGREDGPAKPDPSGVLQICSAFSIRPQEAIVVGDYLFDLLCARSAGAIAVWLRHSNAKEDFSAAAAYVIDALPELLPIIESLGQTRETSNA